MNNNYVTGVALAETKLLADVCGVNDYNLKLMEQHFGAKVFVRGNELFIDSSDEKILNTFNTFVTELIEAISEGIPCSPEYIAALYASLTPEGDTSFSKERISCAELFRNAAIQIPGAFSRVYPRTTNQALYLCGLEKHDISFAVGPAGTGKTYLAVAWALKEILSKKRRRLVLTRPVVEAGESLGYLPGDLSQKINPYLRPLYDAMESIVPFDSVRRMEENHTIEIAPLAYMRGRSLNNCVVILDEAQNTTKEQMKMFLTRLGEGSAAVVTGDVTQIDLPRKAESGLVHALKLLDRIDDIFICHMDGRDVVRNPLVRKIIDAYESEF